METRIKKSASAFLNGRMKIEKAYDNQLKLITKENITQYSLSIQESCRRGGCGGSILFSITNTQTASLSMTQPSSSSPKRKLISDGTCNSYHRHLSEDIKTNKPHPNIECQTIKTSSALCPLDPWSAQRVCVEVRHIVNRWGAIAPIPPHIFLMKLLKLRGYSTDTIASVRSNPSPKQIQDYDNEVVRAIRESNFEAIKNLQAVGISMSACNKYSESIVHIACRRANYDVVEYILNSGGDYNIQDDYGRTPLHDACWRLEPRFDIVTLLLDRNIDLLRMVDVRGATPLSYIRPEHWLQWCAYFYHQKEKYWKAQMGELEDNAIINETKSNITTCIPSNISEPLHSPPSSSPLDENMPEKRSRS